MLLRASYQATAFLFLYTKLRILLVLLFFASISYIALLKMKISQLSTLAVLAGSVLAQNATNATTTSSGSMPEYTIMADNITAIFIPYGARMRSLQVPDNNGTTLDVLVGYDNGDDYPQRVAEGNHTYFGAVVGRYANRIKNGTFELDGNTYHIPENENHGEDTLHGGTVGYDQRNWTMVAYNGSSVSFQFLDDALEGFPGTVLTTATYTVSSFPSGPQGQMRPRLIQRLVSIALDTPTPIMLANHNYWNLNAFRQGTILNDTTLWMPYSNRYIQIDGIEIPNGTFGLVQDVPALDFLSPKLLGTAINEAQGLNLCGTGCNGVDNAFTVDRPATLGEQAVVPVLSLWSDTTGIQMTVSTNQIGLQIYTCNGQNGTIPIKQSQIQANQGINGATDVVNQYGCIVIETQAYIDAINYPQWGVSKYEIFSPETYPAVNYQVYDFSTF